MASWWCRAGTASWLRSRCSDPPRQPASAGTSPRPRLPCRGRCCFARTPPGPYRTMRRTSAAKGLIHASPRSPGRAPQCRKVHAVQCVDAHARRAGARRAGRDPRSQLRRLPPARRQAVRAGRHRRHRRAGRGPGRCHSQAVARRRRRGRPDPVRGRWPRRRLVAGRRHPALAAQAVQADPADRQQDRRHRPARGAGRIFALRLRRRAAGLQRAPHRHRPVAGADGARCCRKLAARRRWTTTRPASASPSSAARTWASPHW